MPAASNSVMHIAVDPAGVAWIEGTRIKVIEIVLEKMAHGSSSEEIHFQYPHLSLAQIHAAFAYYYDHREALDDEIDRRYRNVEALREAAQNSPLQKRLRALAEKK